MTTVGIPSTLLYYHYYPMWKTFFQELGVKVKTSGPTNKKILDQGVKEALADACAPVKLFFGHVAQIKDSVDYLFIPRVVCLNKKTVYCPKFLGLPDMIRHSFDNLPPIIDTRLDARAGFAPIIRAYARIGNIFTNNKIKILRAYRSALKVMDKFNKLMQSGLSPLEAMKICDAGNAGAVNNIKINKEKENIICKKNGVKTLTGDKHDRNRLCFGVLGYPYIIFDNYISVGLLKKLHDREIKTLTFENLPLKKLEKQNLGLRKRLFWTYSDLVLRAAHYLFEQKSVDGIIHVTVFGCGPDSITGKLIELKAQKQGNIPFTIISLDEHSGEGGIATRLEAFVDMVKRR